MRFALSTEEFVYDERPTPGFPLIFDDEMQLASPFHDYLVHKLLDGGERLSPLTWEAYGRSIWDFARFLNDNGYSWNQPFRVAGKTPLRRYRDWQLVDCKLNRRTVNRRIRTACKFYEWALEAGLVERLPFNESDIYVSSQGHSFAELAPDAATARESARPNLIVDEWDEEPAFLISSEAHAVRGATALTSHRLLFDLMARVGLRSAEATTFPLDRVFDPTTGPNLAPGSMIEVTLDPRKVKTKFGKRRVVHVPYSLMQDMHAYTLHERRLVEMPTSPSTLLLTQSGRAFSKDSTLKAIKSAGQRVGVTVHPHMLRHTYSIYTLMFFRTHPEIPMEPLLYLRDRLGHESIDTVMIYLKQLERIAGADALAMLNEFDQLYDLSPNAFSSLPGHKHK